jgi:hypothetical protein
MGFYTGGLARYADGRLTFFTDAINAHGGQGAASAFGALSARLIDRRCSISSAVSDVSACGR